ncbi:MAG: hypothetical protein KDD64_04545 [Bdellovibrionales bacterium]|nr:hypothetical protein [Bdellovibrionales bacterium]
MGRPIYPYELNDPDFSWLMNNFRDTHPEYMVVEDSCLPIVLVARHAPLNDEVTKITSLHAREEVSHFDTTSEFKPLDIPESDS